MMKKLFIITLILFLSSCSYIEEPVDLDEESTEELLTILYDGYANFDTEVDISELNIKNNDYNINIISELLSDKVLARYYYTDVFDSLNYITYEYNGRIAKIYLPYQYMKDNEIDMIKSVWIQNNTEYQLDKIISLLDEQMTDLEKILFLHDYLVSTTQYDHRTEDVAIQLDENFTIQGTLNEHQTMCTGYTLTLYRLLEKAGINSEIIESDDMHHTWLAVELNGNMYHIDPTWNDRNYLKYQDEDKSIDGIVLHDYFLVDDATILEDHRIWEESNINCTDDEYTSGYIFNNNNSKMNYYDGFWYYTENIEQDGYLDTEYIYFVYSYDTIIHKSKIDGSQHSEINLNSDIKQLLGYDNLLFFFNNYGVYSYNIDTEEKKKLHSVGRKEKITELGLIDKTLKVTYQKEDYEFYYEYITLE